MTLRCALMVPVFVTYHPSAVLREDDQAAEIRAALVTDLCAAWAATGQ